MPQNPNTTKTVPTIKGIYVAVLSQTGTTDPTVNVLQNGLGEEVIWTRISAGKYRGTVLTNLFLPTKTTVYTTAHYNNAEYCITIKPLTPFTYIELTTANDITDAYEDGLLAHTPITITVYN